MTPTPPRRTPGFKHLAHLPIATLAFTEGTPTAVTLDGRTWQVAAPPTRWFERAKWWENNWSPREAPVVDVPMMRVQVRHGGPTSQLVTMDLAQDRTGAWRVVSVDGAEPTG